MSNSERDRLEPRLRSFERAWETGSPPDLESALGEIAEADRAAAILGFACIDLEFRLPERAAGPRRGIPLALPRPVGFGPRPDRTGVQRPALLFPAGDGAGIRSPVPPPARGLGGPAAGQRGLLACGLRDAGRTGPWRHGSRPQGARPAAGAHRRPQTAQGGRRRGGTRPVSKPRPRPPAGCSIPTSCRCSRPGSTRGCRSWRWSSAPAGAWPRSSEARRCLPRRRPPSSSGSPARCRRPMKPASCTAT